MTFRWFGVLVDTFLGRVPGKIGRDDTATRMARDADFHDHPEPSTRMRQPMRKADLVAELERSRREGN